MHLQDHKVGPHATQTVKDHQLNHSYPSQNIKQWFVAGKVDEQMYSKLPPPPKPKTYRLFIKYCFVYFPRIFNILRPLPRKDWAAIG